MKITCIQCQAVYSIDDALVTAEGVKAQCPACGDIQVVRMAPGEGAQTADRSTPSAAANKKAADLDLLASGSPGAEGTAPQPGPPPLPKAPAAPVDAKKAEPMALPAQSDDPFASLDLDLPSPAAPPPAGGDPFAASEVAPPMPQAVPLDDPFADLGLPPAGAPPPAAPKPAGRPPAGPAPATDDMLDLPEITGNEQSSLAADGGVPKPASLSSAAVDAVMQGGSSSRCQRCGGMLGDEHSPDGMCDRCRDLSKGAKGAIEEDREWRVKKPDGVIYGPLTLAEVKAKFTEGQVTASDQVARGEGEFKLISSFPEFAGFFRRPSQIYKTSYKAPPPPSHALRWILIALVIIVGGGAATVYFGFPELLDFSTGELETSIVEEALVMFEQDVPNPSGTSAENVAQGRKLMMQDERLGYMEADLKFKAALILDPSSPDAFAGWVQNRALLDANAPDVTQRKVALDLLNHARERSPDHAGLMRAQAYLYYSLGRLSDAQEAASKVLAVLDEDPEGLVIMGATYLDASTDLAVGYFERAQKANPELNLTYRLLGEAKIRLGKFHEALQFFRARLEKDPSQYASLDAVARVYLAVGKFDLAAETYEHILGNEPYRVETAVSLAQLQAQILGKRRQAMKLIKGLLAQDKEKVADGGRALLLAEKSVNLRLQNKIKPAREAVEEALKLDPMLIPALYSQAWLSLRAADLGNAIVQFKALRSHLPEQPRVLLHIAEAEAQVPHFETAVKQFKLAVEAAPDDVDAVLMLATLHLELDNPNLAYTWLRRATKLDPFYDLHHRKLTPYYDGSDLLAMTVERSRKAAAKYADDPLAQALAGAVMLRAGNDSQAQGLFLRALQIDEECFPANFFLGMQYLRDGHARKALPYLKQAQKVDSLHHQTDILLAYALLKTGSSARAEKLVKGVLKSAPGNLSARLCLAEVLLAKKKRKAAIEQLLKVYEGDNSNLPAKERLFNLNY